MINPDIDKAWERIAYAVGVLLAIIGGTVFGSIIYVGFKCLQDAKVFP